MKSIFLYQLTEPCISINEQPRGIYKLNCDLIGIDTKVIDKQTRIKWVTEMNLKEFHVLQRWFANFTCFANSLGVTILSFKFNNEIDAVEQAEINKCIFNKRYNELINSVTKVVEENETDIKCISFSYKKCIFDIYSTGVMNVSGGNIADTDSLCLSDTSFLTLLSGEEYEVGNNYENI